MTDSLGDVLCFLQNPDRLFSFFGCFGDVVRVKVMFRKQDTALIQFVDDFHVRKNGFLRVSWCVRFQLSDSNSLLTLSIVLCVCVLFCCLSSLLFFVIPAFVIPASRPLYQH